MTRRRELYEIGFMGLSVLLGLGYLTTVPEPETVAALMPDWMVAVWACALLLSGILGLVGCLWRGRSLVGYGLERAALGAQSGALLLIGGCIAQAWLSGRLPLFPALGLGFLSTWLTMNVLRIRQIGQDVKILTEGRV